jgi:lysozyme
MDKSNQQLLHAELLLHEGVRLKPYRDSAGYLTIGTGRNLEAIGISQDENALMLNNDIHRAEQALNQHCPWWRTLNPVRQRVLMNMCFNLGIATLLQFTQTLQAIQKGTYEQAATHMLNSQWASQVGGRAVWLAKAMRNGAIS